MQFDEKIKKLQGNLDTKTIELATITAEKKQLSEKLIAEKKEKKEQVSWKWHCKTMFKCESRLRNWKKRKRS